MDGFAGAGSGVGGPSSVGRSVSRFMLVVDVVDVVVAFFVHVSEW